MQPLLAYAPDRYAPGVERPGIAGLTYDWREPATSTENTAGIVDGYTVAPIAEAFSRHYNTDAHLVTGLLHRDGEPLAHQPRLNKSCLPWIREQGYEVLHGVLLFDIDNPGHREHGPLDHEIWARRLREELPEFGFYLTSKGVRLVVALDRWVVPETAEEMLETIFGDLERRGFAPDRTCRDWTRHYRLPHVKRAGADYRSPVVDLAGLRPQTIAPTPIVRRRAAGGPSRSVAAFTQQLPLSWSSRIERLGDLLRGGYEGRRHDISLALSGALLSVQVPPELLPAIISAVVVRAGWRDPRLHESSAVDTVSKWQERDVVTGLSALRWLAPPVAEAVEAIGSATAEERAREENARPAPPTLPVDMALEQIQQEIRNAYGLVVLRAQCGLGKSHSAREIAAERAAVKPDAKRAPKQSRTGFSVPDHELAKQHVNLLRADGHAVRRVFGVLSVVDEQKNPVCVYAKQAKHVAGGLSIPRVFCEGNGRAPCDYRETCSAYGGVEGPENARIVVGTHALLGQIDAEVGKSGLLIIDEPPDLLHTEPFTVEDFDVAIDALGMFSARYARAMAPALYVIRNWVATTSEIGGRENNFATALAARPPEDIAAQAIAEVGTDDPREAATLAFPEDHEARIGYAPPLEPTHLIVTRTHEDTARRVGCASRVLRYVWTACQPGRLVSTRVEEYSSKDGATAQRVLYVTGPRMELWDALTSKHEHPVVALDANADLHLPVYQRVVYVHETQQPAPKDIDALAPRFRYREFYAADGAPIERTMIMWGASRKAWFPERRLKAESVALAALERAVRWVLEQPELAHDVCIVTFKLLATALRAAQGDAAAPETWERLKQDPADLSALVERIRVILAPLPGTASVAHYGAIRGLDHWKNATALVTLGDPVPELGGLRHDVAFMELPDPDDRAHRLARAELEQAHGRLRTVHRTKPARSLHIGRVLPGGWYGARILGRSRCEDWARGGEMGKEHGIKGATYGILGKEFGTLGKEHGNKGAEHGVKGAAFGHLGAEAGRNAEQPNRNQGDMDADEVRALVAALGGNRAACEALGVSQPTLSRYKSGDRTIPQEFADKLRHLTRSPLSDPRAGPLPREYISSLGRGASGGSDNAAEDAAE